MACAVESGGPRGYDAAKKVKGRKRHIAVDTQDLLLGVLVHNARRRGKALLGSLVAALVM